MNLRQGSSVLVLLAAVAVVFLGFTPPALAHAQLIETDPAHGVLVDESPTQVELRFNEPVSVSSVTMRSGETVVEGSPRTDGSSVFFEPVGTIPDGTAVLEWQVVSTDGHPIGGALVFHVRIATEGEVAQPQTPVNAGLIVANALMYIGLVLGGGLALFSALVHDGGAESATLRRLSMVLLALGVVGTLVSLGMRTTGFDFSTLPTGSVPAVTAVVLGSALTLAGWGRGIPMVVGVGLALLAPVLTGHTRSFDPKVVMMASDVVHLYAGAVWAGGLVSITLVARRHRSEMATMVSRFSRLAGWALAAVVISGSTLAWTLHRSWDSVVGTDHGRLTLLKLALVLVVAAVGAFSRYRLVPALEAAGAGARRLLSNTTVIEAAGLVLALIIAAALVDKDPAAATVPIEAQGPVQTVAGDLLLTVELETSAPGVGQLRVLVRTPEGETADLVEPVRAAVVSGGDRTSFSMEPGPDGQFATITVPRSREWQLEVRARTDAFTEAVVSLEVDAAGRFAPTAGLLVADAVMPALPGAPTTAVYMSVISIEDDQLVGAASPACDEASLHETVIGSDGTASMESRPTIDLVAGEPQRFESGGLHIMCEGPTVQVGDTVPFSIVTSSGESLKFLVPVVSITDTLD